MNSCQGLFLFVVISMVLVLCSLRMYKSIFFWGRERESEGGKGVSVTYYCLCQSVSQSLTHTHTHNARLPPPKKKIILAFYCLCVSHFLCGLIQIYWTVPVALCVCVCVSRFPDLINFQKYFNIQWIRESCVCVWADFSGVNQLSIFFLSIYNALGSLLLGTVWRYRLYIT